MSDLDNNPALGEVSAPPPVPPVAKPTATTPTSVTTEDKASNIQSSKKLLLWILTTTFVFVIAVAIISYAVIVIRGGTLPATDIISTIVNVLGSLMLNIVNGSPK